LSYSPSVLLTFPSKLLYFFMKGMLAASRAKLLQLQPFALSLFISGGAVIAVFTIRALKNNYFSHF